MLNIAMQKFSIILYTFFLSMFEVNVVMSSSIYCDLPQFVSLLDVVSFLTDMR